MKTDVQHQHHHHVPPTEQMAPVSVEAASDVVAVVKRPRFRFSELIGPLAVFVAFLAFWEFMHRWGMEHILDKKAFLVPSPATVVDHSVNIPQVRHQLLVGLGWTTYASLIGLLISIVAGMTIAVLMAQARWVERSFYPYLVALQAMPVLAIVPLILSVFGGGMGARLFVCVMISIFPIVTNTLFGLTSADTGQHDLFTLREVSAWTRLWKLQFPAAMPAIFTGFRISAGLSVIGAVVGEQFFREGAKPGIGVVMEQFRQYVRFPEVYGGLIIAAALGIAVFFFFGFLGKAVVGHWYESTRRTS
jgi:NitT/TauT family transport system permease protein